MQIQQVEFHVLKRDLPGLLDVLKRRGALFAALHDGREILVGVLDKAEFGQKLRLLVSVQERQNLVNAETDFCHVPVDFRQKVL